jgi:hypothetical protein
MVRVLKPNSREEPSPIHTPPNSKLIAGRNLTAIAFDYAPEAEANAKN